MSYRDRLHDLWQPADPSQTQVKSRKASVSFSLGLLSFFVSILAGVPAIINGLLSLKEIRQSEGRLQGRGLAVWGIVLGVVGSSASGSFALYTAARIRESSHKLDVV